VSNPTRAGLEDPTYSLSVTQCNTYDTSRVTL